MTNNKNLPEGRAVQQKYDDLLPLSRPDPIKPRVTIQSRAKIFSLFSALHRYDDEIANKCRDRLKGKRVELSKEQCITALGAPSARFFSTSSPVFLFIFNGVCKSLLAKIRSAHILAIDNYIVLI